MKRARRGIVLGVLALLGGAVVSVLVAEGIGYSGATGFESGFYAQYVMLGTRPVHASASEGIGRRRLSWYTLHMPDPPIAAPFYQRNFDGLERHVSPPAIDWKGPQSLPAWARLRRPENWPPQKTVGALTGDTGGFELATGWPLPALSMDGDSSIIGRCNGGTVFSSPSSMSQRVLLWRPITSGFALDMLFWAACLAAPVAGIRQLRRARRRSLGTCPACGYSLAGLAGGAACPECGAGAGVAARGA